MGVLKFRALNTKDNYMVDSKFSMASIMKNHILEGNYADGWYTENMGQESEYLIQQYIGIQDRNGIDICVGDNVVLYIKDTHGNYNVKFAEGVIEYRAKEVGSLGCGYGVKTNNKVANKFLYLATLCNCEIEIKKESPCKG